MAAATASAAETAKAEERAAGAALKSEVEDQTRLLEQGFRPRADLDSLAVRRGDGQLANRGFVIDARGAIAARYDKMHMFDVDLASGETWRESAAYRPGETVVTRVGMTKGGHPVGDRPSTGAARAAGAG